MITQEQLIRNLSVMADGEVDFFLGAGASIASGIPTGQNLIWTFKREIYCSEQGISREKYKDLELLSTRKILQDYFDRDGSFPEQNSPSEYSFYFEKCYNSPLARNRFIEKTVSGKNPSLGYLCLAEAIHQRKVKNIWTTNFDALLEAAMHILYPKDEIIVYSSANKESIAIANPSVPAIGKLHGDYRYDWLQNTEKELQEIEEKIKTYATEQLKNRQLIVIGYSGNDESIMSFFESNRGDSSFLSKGLMWATRKGESVNPRVSELIEKYRKSGKHADFVEIDSFESFMFSLYQSLNYSNETIDGKRSQLIENRSIHFTGNPIDSFIKLNAYRAETLPPCNIFITDITSWRTLREVISGSDVIAALYSGKIYAFSSPDKLKKVFGSHVLSEIVCENVPDWVVHRQDSIYIGLLYDLIRQDMISKNIIKYRRNKYYDPTFSRPKKGLLEYNAVEISLTYINGALYLNLLPTVHILAEDGTEVDREKYKRIVNQIISSIYNDKYSENLRMWEKTLCQKKKITFENEGFQISFTAPALSCGGTNRSQEWLTLPAYMYAEPKMRFSDTDKDKVAVNQLKGICQYGPIDYSYSKQHNRPSIRLAVLAPKQEMKKILTHLNALNFTRNTIGKDAFIPNYEGFERVYHRGLSIPTEQQDICIGYNGARIASWEPCEFLDFMKRGVDRFAQLSADFEVLVIYIPEYFAHFRTSNTISADFNFHDAIKLYATERGIKLQLIEEKSLSAYNPCKVMWGLSTSLYAKSSGVLWHPETICDDTAYVGISYAYSKEKGICLGCSQLFDSTGTGIRLILRKISDPIFIGRKSPYMRESDAREMMTQLREQYYRANPVNNLNRIVIHKTTPFIREEIAGITQALKGIDDIELIQIQEYCPWRGIRFGPQADTGAVQFAVKRGLTVKLSEDSFLLWTHGCIIHPELAGKLNYYKNSRGIPAPLLVKRFTGKANGDTLAQEILMLTKMNWNSGDCLYKALPVTLDFAKILSRMSKQDEAIYNKAYDFRYFM